VGPVIFGAANYHQDKEQMRVKKKEWVIGDGIFRRDGKERVLSRWAENALNFPVLSSRGYRDGGSS